MRNNIWKWLVLLLIAVVSFYVTTPVKDKLRFGLDLKGGTSFTLGVDTDKLAESIIAENPDITNKTGAVEAEIDVVSAHCEMVVLIEEEAAQHQFDDHEKRDREELRF